MAKTKFKPKADIVLFINTRKQLGDNKPLFEGNLSLPNTPEQRRGIAVWGYPGKTDPANMVLNGRVSLSPQDQINQHLRAANNMPDVYTLPSRNNQPPLEIAKDSIVVFTARPKEDADPAKNPPQRYGYYYAGKNEGIFRFSLWDGTNRQGNLYLSGPVEEYDPNQEYNQHQGQTMEEDLNTAATSAPATNSHIASNNNHVANFKTFEQDMDQGR